MRTNKRPNVSQSLFSDVLSELAKDGYIKKHLDEQKLQELNPLISKIEV